MENAIHLYRNDYLLDIDYPWVIATQEHLKELFYQANLELAKFYIKNKENSRAINYLTKVISINPLIEEVYCLLMKSFAGIGNWLAVKQYYQSLVTVLQTELGLSPALETTELYHSLCPRKDPAESTDCNV